MIPQLGRRMQFLQQSEIRNMTLECAKVGGVNLSQGVCDTPVPEPVRRAAQAAIDEGCNTYTRYDGLPELRAALARKLEAGSGLVFDPDREIVVTSGSSAAFYGACLGILDPGDEVVLFEPYYGYHVDTLHSLGAVPRYVRLEPPDWAFDLAALDAVLSPRTRAVVVNTPANPSGKVFTRAELEAIAARVTERNLFVLTDEIYEHFVYEGRRHLAPAALPELRSRTITINGLSKTLSITGWRIGFSACRAEWAQRLGFINDLVYICAPAPLQMGVARALDRLDADFYTGLAAEHARKRDRLCTALDRAGLRPFPPQGAYYVLADVSRLSGSTSKERVTALLEKTGVAAVPGSAFYTGSGGEHLARFCFAKTDADLAEACRRLERLR